ncbi:MAG: hypothetical protein V3W45_01855 [Sedimentisphaerales bacterium]
MTSSYPVPENDKGTMKLVFNNLTYYGCPIQLRDKVAFTTEQLQAAELINKMFLSRNKGD